jgi:putative heme-binding domain-containing protein
MVVGRVASIHPEETPLAQQLTLGGALTQAARQRKIALPEEITAWSQRAMIEALASSDEGLARQGVDAVRDVKIEAKLEPLAKIARDEARPEALRVAALESVANLPASRELLAATLADPRHYKLRKRASELLAPGGTAEILAALPTAPFDLAQSMAGDLIEKGDDGCGQLLVLVEAGKASPRLLRNRLIEIILRQRSPALQERAAALTRDLPPEDERLDKVIAQRAKDFANAKPDAEHGAQVFQQHCVVCHRFRNAGGNVGPNLDGAVIRGTTRLIEDLLDPSRNVDPGFRQTIIETTDGQSFAGVNLRAQGDNAVVTDVSGKEITIPKTTIKTQTQTQLSLMPPAFETTLSPGDLNDLLAYLLSPPK